MTQQTSVLQIVPARPDHAPLVAWVLLAAARSHMPRGVWDFLVNDDEPAVLRYLEALASTPEPHFAHYSGFLVAEVDGTPAAALSGYFDAECGLASLNAVLPAVSRALGIDHDAMLAQFMASGGGSMLLLQPVQEPGAWIVEHVATRPEFRRRGLVDALLAGIIEKGRARGATIANIGVFIGNTAAQSAYEKAGFSVIEEIRNADFEAAYGSAGMRELTRAI